VSYLDSRHLRFYEQRAGYAVPSTKWFENRDEENFREPMLYGRENFVQGFNITIGEFYALQLQCSILLALYKDDLQDAKLNSKRQYHFNWDLARIERQLRNNPMLTRGDPPDQWKNYMVRNFVLASLNSQRKPPDGTDKTKGNTWKLGEYKTDISMERRNCFQFRHMKAAIEMFGGITVFLHLRTIIRSSYKDTNPVKDVALREFSFQRLEEEIVANVDNGYDQDKDCIQYRGHNSRYVIVHDDESLRTALVSLRKERNDTVNFVLMPRDIVSLLVLQNEVLVADKC
jgi:hypothetical protein